MQNVIAPALRVRIYYRMSTEKQDASIPQQEKECRAKAKLLGWDVLGEYSDPGQSGLLPWRERPGFLRMLEDCQTKKDCNAILVWKTDRFARADSIDGAEPKQILRDLGIWLESVVEGRIDWNTSQGRMMDFMTSEQNHAYSHGLSAAVVRGQNDYAAAGFRSVGGCPYGYDREYIDTLTSKRMFIRRTERFKSPNSYRLKLVINEDEAATVRWMFDRYEKGESIMGICRELNRKGVVVPYRHRPTTKFKRVQWGLSTVRAMLSNAAYVGTYIVGVTHRKKGMHKLPYQVIKGTIPRIIEDKQFEDVQNLMAEKVKRGIRPRTGGGPLNGILFCGCCGLQLFRKLEWSGTVNKKQITYYTCRTGQENPHIKCRSWRVREDEILPVVLERLRAAIDLETLRQLQSKPVKGDNKKEVARLTARRDALASDVALGTENLLRCNARTFPLLQVKVDELQAELDRAENTLRLAECSAPESERVALLEWLRGVKGRLVTLVQPEGMEWATPELVEPTQRELDHVAELLGNPPCSGTVYVDGSPLTVEAHPDVSEILYYRHDRVKALEIDGVRYMNPTGTPAVQADVAALRSLLLALGLRVALTWTPNGKHFYKLRRADITGAGKIPASIDMAHLSGGGTRNAQTGDMARWFKFAVRVEWLADGRRVVKSLP